MSDNYSLIVKNGTCYIDGKLTKVDIGLSENKIKMLNITINTDNKLKFVPKLKSRDEKIIININDLKNT